MEMVKAIVKKIACRKYVGNIGEAVEQEERLGDEVETGRKFTYLGDRVNAAGGNGAAVTVRTRCGWIKFELMLMYVTSFAFILIQEEIGAERDEVGCRTHEG